jgi:hypothetical protein
MLSQLLQAADIFDGRHLNVVSSLVLMLCIEIERVG